MEDAQEGFSGYRQTTKVRHGAAADFSGSSENKGRQRSPSQSSDNTEALLYRVAS